MSMDKVRISNAIGTSENEYPAPVAISVNGVAWGPAIAPQVDTKKLTIGDASGYKSEIAQALTEGWGQTDAAGNLVYRDGRIHTQATPNDPWPAVIDGIEALLQFQADHPNRPDAIYVDGNRIGQPGSAPGVRYAARNNRLELEFSPPVGTKVEAPAATDTEPARITIAPPAGHQVDVILRGPSIVTLPNIPAPTVPGRMGFVRITDMAGEQMPTGTAAVYDCGPNLLYSAPANGFSCQIAVEGPVVGAHVEIDRDETLTIEALGLSGPVLLSYRTPNW